MLKYLKLLQRLLTLLNLLPYLLHSTHLMHQLTRYTHIESFLKDFLIIVQACVTEPMSLQISNLHVSEYNQVHGGI